MLRVSRTCLTMHFAERIPVVKQHMTIYDSELFYKDDLPFLPIHLFIYSITYLYRYGLANIYFILQITIQYCHHLFCCSNYSGFAHWELFQVSCKSFGQCSHPFFSSTSLLSSITRCSRLIYRQHPQP